MREQQFFLPFRTSVYEQSLELPDETWENVSPRFEGFEQLMALLDQWPAATAETSKPDLPTGEIPTNDLSMDQRVQFVLDNLS